MDRDSIIQKLRAAPNRKAVSRESGVPYQTICNLLAGRYKSQLTSTLEKLEQHFSRQENQ